MKRVLTATLSLLFVLSIAGAAQNPGSGTGDSRSKGTNSAGKRPPIFRATSEQIKQVQAILKERGFYSGEQVGKLDDDTRAGLRKYQEAEKIKVTGTLNKVTLEKMGIPLTDRQKAR